MADGFKAWDTLDVTLVLRLRMKLASLFDTSCGVMKGHYNDLISCEIEI